MNTEWELGTSEQKTTKATKEDASVSQQIVIPCEIVIEPGDSQRQAKIRLSASGETVVEGFENDLDKGILFTVSLIVDAHARLLAKWAKSR